MIDLNMFLRRLQKCRRFYYTNLQGRRNSDGRKEEWKRLCQKLSEMGVLTEIDMVAVAAYCQIYAFTVESETLQQKKENLI